MEEGILRDIIHGPDESRSDDVTALGLGSSLVVQTQFRPLPTATRKSKPMSKPMSSPSLFVLVPAGFSEGQGVETFGAATAAHVSLCFKVPALTMNSMCHAHAYNTCHRRL